MSGKAEWKGEQFIKQNGKCHWCKHPMERRNSKSRRFATIEHLLPLAKGGADDPSNCVLACFLCNNRRGDARLTPDEAYKQSKVEPV